VTQGAAIGAGIGAFVGSGLAAISAAGVATVGVGIAVGLEAGANPLIALAAGLLAPSREAGSTECL